MGSRSCALCWKNWQKIALNREKWKKCEDEFVVAKFKAVHLLRMVPGNGSTETQDEHSGLKVRRTGCPERGALRLRRTWCPRGPRKWSTTQGGASMHVSEVPLKQSTAPASLPATTIPSMKRTLSDDKPVVVTRTSASHLSLLVLLLLLLFVLKGQLSNPRDTQKNLCSGRHSDLRSDHGGGGVSPSHPVRSDSHAASSSDVSHDEWEKDLEKPLIALAKTSHGTRRHPDTVTASSSTRFPASGPYKRRKCE